MSTSIHDRTRELIAHFDQMRMQSEAWRAERRAECALLGHVSSGEVFLTTAPIHTCWHCGMRYQIGQGLGWTRLGLDILGKLQVLCKSADSLDEARNKHEKGLIRDDDLDNVADALFVSAKNVAKCAAEWKRILAPLFLAIEQSNES